MTWRLARLPLQAVLTSEAHSTFAADPPAPAPREESFLSALRQRLRSDEELALQLQQGDADALTVLFKRHSPLLLRDRPAHSAQRQPKPRIRYSRSSSTSFAPSISSTLKKDRSNLAPDVRLPARPSTAVVLSSRTASSIQSLSKTTPSHPSPTNGPPPRAASSWTRSSDPMLRAPAPHHRARYYEGLTRRGSLPPDRRKRSRRAP